MLSVQIPGVGRLAIAHLVLDYNGTLAIDGKLLPGVKARMRHVARTLAVHVLTADTFGKARAALRGIDCRLRIVRPGAEDRAKAAYVRKLGRDRVACIGNGRNDRLMLKAAVLGIATMQREGAAAESIAAADIVVNDVRDAFDLLLAPRRLIATLRA